MAQRGSFHLERRSAERFPVSLSVQTDKGPGVTRDVSTSGLCLIPSEQLFEVGDQMEVVLIIPDPDEAENAAHLEFRVRGRVVRVESESGALGVQILSDEGSGHLAWAF
jgi:hypothetical protein